MPKISIEHETKLSRDEILEQMRDVMAKLEDRFGITGEWEGETYRFKRSGLDGSAEITDGKVQVNMTLGMMLSALKGRIQDEMKETLQRRLPS